MYTTEFETPLGKMTAASDGENLTGLWIDGQKYHGVTGKMAHSPDLPIFKTTENWLERYFSDMRPDISEIPLAPAGSEFRLMVWNILCGIPYGECRTYGEIAKTVASKLGKEKMSCQAVGGAVGHNPISVIIPCHRVVGSDGNLTGYAGGIDRKVKLLEHEGTDMYGLFVPSKGTAL